MYKNKAKEKEGITAFTVVYNEEKVIERCLKSLYDVVDEIILIHDGICEDKTIKIAKKYTPYVYQREHKGMGELHVIEAIKKSNYKWLLRIDADEYLSEDLRKNIRALTKNEDVDAYSFIWKIWNGKKYITKKFPRKQCLFRKEKCYFIEFLHKELKTFSSVCDTRYVLEHRPLYNNLSLKVLNKKWKKWAEIEAEYYLLDDINTWNCPEEIKNQFVLGIKKKVSLAKIYLCPLWFVFAFFKSFTKRGFYKNVKTWKFSLFQGIYGWYLCYFICKKINKKVFIS